MGGFPRRIGTGQGYDPIDDRLGQRRDAWRARLVAVERLAELRGASGRPEI